MEILKCKSYAEIGRLLGYNYYNSRVKKIITNYCEENGLNAEEIILNNKKKPNICLFCGKELKGKRKFLKKFCDSSCAAKYNNIGRVHSEESKEKVSKTLKEKYKNGILVNPNLGKIFKKTSSFEDKTRKYSKQDVQMFELSELISNDLVLNLNNVVYEDKQIPFFKIKEKHCVICGNKFIPTLTKNGNISKTKVCSEECHKKLVSDNSKNAMKKLVEQGKHQGWKTRNIVSYPEKFWMGVLDNNLIPYIKEKYVFNKYFLDFFIEKNGVKIDLEIDGKQHLYEDRKLHDKIRDKLLTENGIIVYRIAWNEINSDEGKQTMKNKIDNFLSFYNNI